MENVGFVCFFFVRIGCQPLKGHDIFYFGCCRTGFVSFPVSWLR